MQQAKRAQSRNEFAGRTSLTIGPDFPSHVKVKRQLKKDFANEITEVYGTERSKDEVQELIMQRRREEQKKMHVGQRLYEQNMQLLKQQRSMSQTGGRQRLKLTSLAEREPANQTMVLVRKLSRNPHYNVYVQEQIRKGNIYFNRTQTSSQKPQSLSRETFCAQ